MKTRTTVVSLTLFITLLFPSLASAASLSATQIQAVLSLLQAFGLDAGTIANVQSALGGAVSTTPQSNCLSLNNNLYLDQTDAGTNGEVTKLQQFLGGRVTGYFGPATLQLVESWQAAHGVVSSGSPDTTGYGYVGPKTRGAMSCGTNIANTPASTSTSSLASSFATTSPPGVANRVENHPTTTPSGTVPATPAQPTGQTGTTTVPATPATPIVHATFIITASAGAGGTIAPSGQISVAAGSEQAFTITANPGYQILSKFVDGASVGGQMGMSDGYTFNSVSANHTITANFFRGNDATLGDLTVNGSRIAGFSGNVYSYNVALPAGTTAIPVVEARTNDQYASVQITKPTSLPGSATILVTAQDGITTNSDTVNFTLANATTQSDNKRSTTLVLQDNGSLPAVPEVPTINVQPNTTYTYALSLTNSILLGGDISRKVSITSFTARLPSPYVVAAPVVCPSGWGWVNTPNRGIDVGMINCVESDANNRQFDITYGQTGSVSFTLITPASSGTTDLSLPVSYLKNDGSSGYTTWSPAVHIVVGSAQ